MKPRAFKGFVTMVLALWLTASLSGSAAQVGEDAQGTATPAPTAKPADTPKVKRPKGSKDTGDPSLPPKVKKAKEIPFPVPVGHDAKQLKVPSYDQMGKLLSVIVAAQARHIDNDHVQLDTMTFDLTGNDGGDPYKVVMPTSVLDLKTNVVTTDSAVTIQTKQFDLYGARAEFNTVERSALLRGHVHMRIHNLKQVANFGPPAAGSQ